MQGKKCKKCENRYNAPAQNDNMKTGTILTTHGLNHTMKIGRLTLKNPFLLAPLAGYTDLAFRLLCRELGASMCCSEMISCHGIVRGQQKTLELLHTVPEERPVAFQLFGNDPAMMGDAASILSTYPVDIIDINMGCPVRKVIKKGSGAALMKDLNTAEAIISAVCRSTSLPVTVKFRSGWNSESLVAGDFAVMSETAGAAALTVHARTCAQGFGGRADRNIIRQVKQRASIPVIGNGDILTYQDGLNMMAETGCDGVMIGRGALGNPWVFRKQGRPATFTGRRDVLLRHLELCRQYLPGPKVLFRIKNHAVRYLAGLSGAGGIRKLVMEAASVDEIINLLDSID
ncbi:MAG: tRNA dihydrouridine synthase DusB [Desulfobulbaceae bacterium]|nr:tRNA dihydrouridine synthase DusB [Desulfobulbaceae bacterium]